MRRRANPAQTMFAWGFGARPPRVDPRAALRPKPEFAVPARRHKTREKLAPSPVPLDCAVIGIDPGERSGYSMWERGKLVEYGECDVFGTEPTRVLEGFLLSLRGPHVMVIERPFRVRYQNQTGIGTADKIWRVLAVKLGFARRIVRLYPGTWRSRTLSKGWHKDNRQEVKARELREAQTFVVAQLGWDALDVGPESAPAVFIGHVGSYAGEVLKVLPKVRGSKARAA